LVEAPKNNNWNTSRGKHNESIPDGLIWNGSPTFLSTDRKVLHADAMSISKELMAIVSSLPSVPLQALQLASQRKYGMFEHFGRFPWVLETYLYEDQDGLLAALNEKVIGPAEAKAKEQTGR
jgi:hypothetical protein